jgi:hypothetical protein
MFKLRYTAVIVKFGDNLMAEIISRQGEEITIQVKLKLTGSMLDMEQAIQNGVNETGCIATKEALTKFEATGRPIQIGSVKMTSKGKVKKEYETPYGTIELERHVYQTAKGGKVFCPLDEKARIIIHSTPKFAKMITYKYASLSAKDVARDLEENHSRHVARGFIQNITDYVGAIAESTEQQWDYEIPEQSDVVKIISISLDGTCILMKNEGYREAMTGNIVLYNKSGERLHTIYIGAAPEYGKELFLTRLYNEVDKIKKKYPKAKYVGIADGAASNWAFLETHTTYHVLDFYHASEYLTEASYAFADKEAERRAWLDEACHKLKHEDNGALNLLHEMQKLLKMTINKKLSKTKTEGLTGAIKYFNNQLLRMRYSEYKRKNFPIGSGVTEAACKTLIKQRLCKSAMQWKNQGAKVVIALRSLVQTTGRWAQFWSRIDQHGAGNWVIA